MRKNYIFLTLLSIIFMFSTTTVSYGATTKNSSSVSVVYNTKTLDFGNKKVVLQDNSVYIPLRVLSEQLYYTVEWKSDTNTVKIFDRLNDIELNMNGNVVVNGVKSTTDKPPIMNNDSVYVPLRFVSETLGVDVSYTSSTKTVKMTGRDIYEISQKDIIKPYLIAYTKNGRKQVCMIGEKLDRVDPTIDQSKTVIQDVNRTPYSDIITVTYGVSTSTYTNQLYVKNATLISNSNKDTEAYDKYTLKPIETYYLNNRVALLTSDSNFYNYVTIFDDTTGKLLYKFRGEDLVPDKLKEGHYGEINNIQSVGKNFVVVNMMLPYTLGETEQENDFKRFYYTTIINLETNELTTVYEHSTKYNDHYPFFDNDMALAGGYAGLIFNDGIIFDSTTTDETELKFLFKYIENNKWYFDWITIKN